jgi:hypothetical protein
MLAEETDPIQRIIGEWDLIVALKLSDRNAEAVAESQVAIDLASQFPYDMSAYDNGYERIFAPAVPWMLTERASMRGVTESEEVNLPAASGGASLAQI